MEIELIFNDIEDHNGIKEKRLASCKIDHSVRGWGLEIVTQPMGGDKGLKRLNKLFALLENAETDSSCGLHVHFDARDLSWFDIWKIHRVYYRVQKELMTMVEKGRVKNETCAPIHSIMAPGDRKSFLKRAFLLKRDQAGVHSEFIDVIKKHAVGPLKYRLLNIHRYFHDKSTIEVRLHHGTILYDDVKLWIQVNSAIIQYALDCPNPNKPKRIKIADIIKKYYDVKTADNITEQIEKRKEYFAQDDAI